MKTKDEALKLALEALEDAGKDDFWRYQDKAITAIKEALMSGTDGAQPEQPKYRRGNRLVCLETEEYCVIHISGTDRQWVKFPDSYIGVYTNEQVAELFELLPKELEQEPVGWYDSISGQMDFTFYKPQRKPSSPSAEWIPVYSRPIPPQRTWVGLTNDELTDLFYNENLGQESAVSQAIALLKERNT